MSTRYVVSPWGVPFAFHEMSAVERKELVNAVRSRGTLPEGEGCCLFRPLMREGRAVVEAGEGTRMKLMGYRFKWSEAMWIERQIRGLYDVDAMVRRMALALEGKTKSFTDELKLHKEIHDAFVAADIPHDREVNIPEAGRVDFIAWACIAVEVKAKTGGGRGPLRQLFRYLEDPRFEGGVILSTKKVDLPMAAYEAADGRVVKVRKIELWRNAI